MPFPLTSLAGKNVPNPTYQKPFLVVPIAFIHIMQSKGLRTQV